eukprot:3584339-Rhodomonas_salina.1
MDQGAHEFGPGSRVLVCQAWHSDTSPRRVRGAPCTVARVLAGSDGSGSVRVWGAPGTVMLVRV